ncbi:Fumagillin dodecapentaenoate synthase [Colletotrichum siamense]|nr:Fumagillin dodecapentaenoate synthase [Colletotrichum siamense]
MRNIDPNGSGTGACMPEHDPVVICGMAMRLPGGVSNSEQFWDLLVNKRCGSIPVPKSRFNAKGYYSEHKRPGTIQLKQAYFMDHVGLDRFDASHFPFSRKEVEKMDPVQRMLLEITWECLENAGETDWQGKNVGCYVGSFMEDWGTEMDRDTQHFSTYPAGKWDIMLSNRISYAYDFHGPSMTVRTGCSATLVALNLAEQAVKSGECSSAIVAGCNIFLSAASATKASYGTLGTVLSPDGICKTFDADCNGYGRGEAINAVYVKRLSHALRDGNPIRAIIRSTATQHDGKKPGLLNPNTFAQEALIRHTYNIAGITDYSQTSFFECHGTGTPTGDPTEVSAVTRVFGEKGVLIGGVKPNTGHSEGAAALTSIIKVVLMLERGIIAPNINFSTPNPDIPWADGRIKVPTESQPFPSDRRKRVSVNAFGIGGTNAHAILEAYEGNNVSRSALTSSRKGSHLLLFSASNPQSLHMLEEAYKQHASERRANLNDLAYTLGCRRSYLNYRSFLIAHDGSDGPHFTESESLGSTTSTKARRTVFVFNGQGAQWPTMGKTLIDSNSIFLQCIRRLDVALSRLPQPPSWKIEHELSKAEGGSHLMESEFSLPCSTAVQIGITEILRSWSIRPDAVCGHSSGEIAGAFAAGALTADEAIVAAYFRGYIPKSMGTARQGTMAAIGLGSQDVSKYLESGAFVACENSQNSTTISGDIAAIESAVSKAKADGVFARQLTVDRAYHSPHMEVYGKAYEEAIRPFIKSKAPEVPFFSSVTEERVTDAGALDAAYWHQSLVQPVRFNGSLRRLLRTYGQATNPVLIEVGARPALKGPIKQILDDFPNINASYVPTLEHHSDGNENMQRAAGRLFCENVSFDHRAVTPPGKPLTDAPTYTWAHDESFQEEHRIFKAYRDCQFPMHDLLGRQNFETSALEPTWRKVLQVEDLPWLGDHMINGQIIFPFAAYLSIAEEALRQVTGGVLEAFSAKDFSVTSALHLEPGNPAEIHTRLRRIDESSFHVQITSWKNDVWTEHCSAEVSAGPFPLRPRQDIKKKEFPRLLSPQYWYTTVQDRGFTYGPTFRGLDDISVSPYSREATACVHPMDDPSDYLIHPTALDQCFQTLVTAGCHGQHRKAKYVSMPSSVKEIFISRATGNFWATATSNSSPLGELSGSLLAYTDDGKEVMSMSGVQGSQIATQAGTDELPLLSHARWNAHANFYPFHELHGQDSLATAIDILKLTNPQLRVLEVGTGSDTTTRVLLEHLRPEKGRQYFSKYTYATLSSTALREAEEAFSDIEGLELGCLDPFSDDKPLDLESGSYDIVISNSPFDLIEDGKTFLNRFKDLLRPSGLLVLLDIPRHEGKVSESLLLACKEGGFDVTNVEDRPLAAATLILRLPVPVFSDNICIVSPEQPHQLVDHFRSALESSSIPTRTCFSTKDIQADEALVFFWDIVKPYLYNITEEQFAPLIELLSGHKKPIIWVTPHSQTSCTSPDSAMIHGLARTLRSELKTDITVVELDTLVDNPGNLAQCLLQIVKSLPLRRFNDVLSPDFEFFINNGAVQVPRFDWTTAQAELSRCSSRRAAQFLSRLLPKKPRQIDSLNWINFPLQDLESGSVRVEVKASAIWKDDADTVKRIVDTSKLCLGHEGAGVITEVGRDVQGFRVGDRVMFLSSGALTSHLDISPTRCLRLEEETSFEIASSLPFSYAAAFLAVVEFGRIQKDAVVLLHFVQSHLSLALVQILKSIGAKIHAIVDSETDQWILENDYQVPQSGIFTRGGETIISQIRTSINGSRVDYVLGLPGHQSEDLLKCLSSTGTFLDISDSPATRGLPETLRSSQAYRVVNTALLSVEEPELIGRAFQECKSYFSEKPRLSWTTLVSIFDADHSREAFQAASQEGSRESKVILQTPDQDQRKKLEMSSSATGLSFRSDAAYLMVGGLGGLGRAVSTWMVENGAKELVFLSRSSGGTPETSNFLEELRSQGCLVKTVAGSVTNLDDVSGAIKSATKPVAGVIQMSMVLRDNATTRMTFTEWRECVSPKVDGTLNLHNALLHQQLDFFLLFSSMSGITGQIGQANYNAANAYLDAFVKFRHGLGLPASVIDIGVMGGIGVVAQTDNMELRAKAAGYHVLGEQDLLDCMTASILHSQPNPDATSDMSQMVLGLWSQKPLADPSTHVLWKRDARMGLAYSFNSQRGSSVQEQAGEDKVDAIVFLAKTNPEKLQDEATIELIVKHIGNAMSELLAQPDAEILPTALLDDIGLDSLNAIELTGWISQYFFVDLPLFDLIHTPTLWDLAVKVAELMYEQFGQANN